MALSALPTALALPADGDLVDTLEARSNPITVVYECEKSDGKGGFETCNTMCYGINCGGFGKTYTPDNPDQKTSDSRRASAGCGDSNRCSKDSKYGKGWECDEFPMASTSEASKGGQINRCVLSKGQRYQGGKSSRLWSAKKYCNNTKGCKVTFSFQSNEDKYQYCKPKPDCTPDGNIYNKNGPVTKSKRDSLTSTNNEGGYYVLRSGTTIYSPSDLTIGTLALREAPFNETENIVSSLDSRAFVGEEDDIPFIEDEVVAKA